MKPAAGAPVVMAMFYKPRFVHRVYAWVRGRFWIPCPICKKGFAEHEWLDGNDLWVTERDSVAVCPRCADRAAEQNKANGYPAEAPSV